MTTIMQNTPRETSREVPLERLTGTQPQTFTFEGSQHWDTDVFGRPAPIDYSWSYTITIQRVDATGKPL